MKKSSLSVWHIQKATGPIAFFSMKMMSCSRSAPLVFYWDLGWKQWWPCTFCISRNLGSLNLSFSGFSVYSWGWVIMWEGFKLMILTETSQYNLATWQWREQCIASKREEKLESSPEKLDISTGYSPTHSFYMPFDEVSFRGSSFLVV